MACVPRQESVHPFPESLYKTITTQAGTISQNPRLDGFIAEQYHAQTFNMNAEATGSQYRAKVLEPTGNGYAKNSVDIVIVDGDGKVVRRYQSKYCKDAKATEQAFEHRDYRGQQKLVPEGQERAAYPACLPMPIAKSFVAYSFQFNSFQLPLCASSRICSARDFVRGLLVVRSE